MPTHNFITYVNRIVTCIGDISSMECLLTKVNDVISIVKSNTVGYDSYKGFGPFFTEKIDIERSITISRNKMGALQFDFATFIANLITGAV